MVLPKKEDIMVKVYEGERLTRNLWGSSRLKRLQSGRIDNAAGPSYRSQDGPGQPCASLGILGSPVSHKPTNQGPGLHVGWRAPEPAGCADAVFRLVFYLDQALGQSDIGDVKTAIYTS